MSIRGRLSKMTVRNALVAHSASSINFAAVASVDEHWLLMHAFEAVLKVSEVHVHSKSVLLNVQ